MSKMMLRGILLTIAVLTGVVPAIGQLRQAGRYEVAHRYSDEYFTVISLEAEGLALLQEKDRFQGTKRLWEMTLLDTAMQQRKVVGFHLDERYPMIGYDVAPQRLYLLFRTGDTNKNSFELIELDTNEGAE